MSGAVAFAEIRLSLPRWRVMAQVICLLLVSVAPGFPFEVTHRAWAQENNEDPGVVTPADAADEKGVDGADSSASTARRRHLVVIQGAEGTDEFGEMFQAWAAAWEVNGAGMGFHVTRIHEPVDGREPSAQVEDTLSQLTSSSEVDELWVILIGHGTFDGVSARFNLVGPDISAAQMATWLRRRQQTTVLINCAAGSAPFLAAVRNPHCVVVSATTSPDELNFCRFGRYLSEAVVNPENDLDKDNQVSLLEASIAASRETLQYYEREERLATEHAMIDDNGDGLGTPLEWFRGIRVTREVKAYQVVDGIRANQIFFIESQATIELTSAQRERRDLLERSLESLRKQKSRLAEDDYYDRLEAILLELGEVYLGPVADADPSGSR